MISDNDKIILSNLLWSERVIKKHIILYNNIIHFNRNFPKETLFKIKVYNYYNNIEYPIVCKCCNNNVKFFNGNYSIYCSNKCSNSDKDLLNKRNETMMDRYGKLSMISDSKVREKINNTFKEKHNVNNISELSKLPETKFKISKTKLSYDKDKKEDIQNKRKDTVLNKWGVDNVSKNIIIKDKIKSSNIEKYGVEYPIMLESIKDLRRSNFYLKTGKYHHFNIPNILNKMQLNRKITLKNNYLDGLKNLGLNIINYDNDKIVIYCSECKNNFEIINYVLYQRLKDHREVCINCNPLNNKLSSFHNELSSFLEENNIDFSLNNRSVLNGKELDIFIPNLNIGIEFNGLYWHSEIYKDKNYHLNKTILCNDKNIRLLHIFEDDWIYRKDICKSIILNSLNCIKNKIYARKCVIKEIKDNKVIRTFLDTNHIQGYCTSSIKLGLYYNNKLVSLMTFGIRGTNGKKEYELIRFCNLLNTSVIGGASKLFKYFIKNFKYDKLISYSDMSIFDGGLYEKLGFKYSHLSSPNYYWIIDGIRKHRFNYNKKKLVKSGYDPSKTEIQIMNELGYYRIWGCGQKKWIY